MYGNYFGFGSNSPFVEIDPQGEAVSGLDLRFRPVSLTDKEKRALLCELRNYCLVAGGQYSHNDSVYNVEEAGTYSNIKSLDSFEIVNYSTFGDANYRYILENKHFVGLLMTGSEQSGGSMSSYSKSWHFVLFKNGSVIGKNETHYCFVGEDSDTERDYYYSLHPIEDRGFAVKNNRLLRYRGDESSVNVPSGIETIASLAFANLETLEEVILPEGVKEIDVRAFSGCPALRRVVLPSTLQTVKGQAFAFCDSLEAITFPEGLETLDEELFTGSYALREVGLPTTLRTIGASCFKNCTALKTITLPSTVESFGECAFMGCTSLTDVTVSSPLPKRAFMGCTALSRVRIEASFEKLESEVFRDCTSLVDVRLPQGLKTIGESAFMGCSSLASALLPDSVETVSDSAYADCTALTRLVIPKTVRLVKKTAFSGCTALSDITAPKGFGTKSGYTIYRKGKNNPDDFVLEKDGTVLVKYLGSDAKVTVPDGVVAIGDYAFKDHKTLSEIILPESVKSMRRGVFSDCCKLKKVTLPEGLESLNSWCFACCTALTELILPKSLVYIGTGCFVGCTALRTITLPSALKTIEEEAFASSGIEEIEIPGSVGYIRKKTFAKCHALRHVTLGEGISTIERQAFESSTVATVTLPSTLRYIHFQAFYYSHIREITFPDGILEIGIDAFSNCSKLCRVDFGKSDPKLPYQAFEDCTALTELILSENMREIGEHAFLHTALPSVTIPASVKSIKKYAFASCKHLREIIFEGDSAIALEGEIFANGPGEQTILFEGDEETFRSMIKKPFYDFNGNHHVLREKTHPFTLTVHTKKDEKTLIITQKDI